MRGRRDLTEAEAAIEYLPGTIVAPIDFSNLFGRSAPVEIDLGCGDGTFLVARAAEFPERNFLGIERLVGRVRSVCRKVVRNQLTNVRVLRIDTACALEHLIPEGSVALFHLLFPDPWPKRRHHRRRTFNESLLRALHRALAPNGLLHVATDHAEYFRAIEERIAADPIFRRVAEISRLDGVSPYREGAPVAAFPRTAFEEKFLAQGLPIYRSMVEKNSPVR